MDKSSCHCSHSLPHDSKMPFVMYMKLSLSLFLKLTGSKLDGLTKRVIPVAGLSCRHIQPVMSFARQVKPDASSANEFGWPREQWTVSSYQHTFDDCYCWR